MRELSLKILYNIDKNNEYSNLTLDKYFSKLQLSDLDKAFVTEIVYGVIKYKLTLDYIINENSKSNKMSYWIRNILRIGLYQILFLDRVPNSAACNESVKLAKKYADIKISKFVNALLRNFVRQLENGTFNIENQPLDIKYSFPKWLIDMWNKMYGKEFTEELLIASSKNANTCIRVNTLKTNKEYVKTRLNNMKIETYDSKISNNALILKSKNPVNDLFYEGYYSIQDEAAIKVVEILEPKKGEKILDMCSAPGGKTTYIAELMQNIGSIDAFDIYEHRIELVNKNAKRLGINIINSKIFDSTKFDEKLSNMYDKILVDAPCSGLGVIRRKPEIKYNRNLDNINEMIKIQTKLLKVADKYLKVGGTLVYSTCTLNKFENEKQIEKFVSENKNYKIDYKKTLFPNIDETDGFFICKLLKIKN